MQTQHISSKVLILVAMLAATSTSVRGQGTFKVKVVPTIVARTADSLSLAYAVTVLPGSTDSLASFLVDAPGTTLHVVPPGARLSRTTANRRGKRGVAEWSPLASLTRAGQSTPRLTVSGRGVLDIVEYWAEPEAPFSDVESDTPADSVSIPDTVIDVHGARGL